MAEPSGGQIYGQSCFYHSKADRRASGKKKRRKKEGPKIGKYHNSRKGIVVKEWRAQNPQKKSKRVGAGRKKGSSFRVNLRKTCGISNSEKKLE